MKKLLWGLLIVGAAFCAQAEYLYWQVTQDTIDESKFLSENLEKGVTYFGQLRYGEGTDYLNYLTYDENMGVIPSGEKVLVDLDVLAGDPTANSYYIEILKYDDVKKDFVGVAKSEVTSYADLSKNGYIGDVLKLPTLEAWTGGVGYTVPEPTGALMMLFGMAFLGLKRRKA